MKTIEAFHFTEVIVPAKAGMINSRGVHKPLHMLPVAHKGSDAWSVQFDELPKLIVRLRLSDGTVGLGEFYRDHNPTVVKAIAKKLLGTELLSLPLNALPIGHYREYDGFECAIWDAVAKVLNLRVVELLGGVMQNKVKVGAWSSYRQLNEVGVLARSFKEQGYDCIKFKAELTDDVIGWAEELRRHAPGMQVIYDPNQRWENFGEVKRLLPELEKIGNVFCLEDPMPLWMLSDYRKLRSLTSVRIVRHVSLPYIYQGQRLHDAIAVIRHDAADGFNFNAGLAKFRQLDAISTAANMYFWHGSEIDLGILEAMYVHQSAASSHCLWPSDIFGRLIRSHDLLKEPLKFEPPYVLLPEGRGLGVELDEAACQAFAVQEFTIAR